MFNIKEIFSSKKNIVLIMSIIVFFFSFAVRSYWIKQRCGIHVDEGYTHVISSFVKYNWAEDYENNRVYTGKELKEITFKNTNSLKKTLTDLAELRRNNDYDYNHSNMYYSLYRIWMLGGSDSLSLEEFINRGCGLNLVFFSISFLFMYLLLKRLFGDNNVIPLGLAAAFLNTGSISNTLFIRPYQLQETIFVILTYTFVVYFQKITNRESFITPKDFTILTLVLGLVILSGYFSLVYVSILGLILLLLCFKYKDNKSALLFAGTFLTGFISALIIYPAYFKGFESHRAAQALSVFNVSDNRTIINFIVGSWNIFINFLFYFPILICLLIAKIKQDKKYSFIAITLICSAFIWYMGVIYIAPYKILRYAMPIFPILSLIVPVFIYSVKCSYKKVLSIIIFLLLTLNALMPSPKESYDTLFRFDNSRKIPFGAVIENINNVYLSAYRFMYKPNVPVIFVKDMVYACYINIIPNMPDEQTYEFSDYADAELLNKYKHYFLLVSRNKLLDEASKFKLPEGYTVIQEFNLGRFQGYELEKE